MHYLLPTFLMFALMAPINQYLTAQENQDVEIVKEKKVEIELMKQIEAERNRLETLEAKLERLRDRNADRELAKAKPRKNKPKSGDHRRNNQNQDKAKGNWQIGDQSIEIEIDEEKIEAWAEEYAESWEKWADKFEMKLEAFYEQQEEHWEKWADKHSEQWEAWGKKFEAGQMSGKELNGMIEKMMKEIPLENVVNDALKQGLGELENMPIEGLDQFGELIGKAVEKSLNKMDLSELTPEEIQNSVSDLVESDAIHNALDHLRNAIATKQEKMERGVEKEVESLEQAMKKQIKETNEKDAALMRELKDLEAVAASRQKRAAVQAKQHAAHLKAALKAKEKSLDEYQKELAKKIGPNMEKQRAMEREVRELQKKADAIAREADRYKAIQKEIEAQAAIEQKNAAEAVRKVYESLKQEKRALVQNKSDIELMRREILKLRKEVEKLRKEKQKN